MKRDMDLIRDLLFAIEEADWGFVDIEHINSIIDKKRHSFVTYHLKLLYEAKLIEGQVTRGTGRRDFNDKMDLDMDYVISVRPWSLTWEGHEYLDTVRDPKIWEDVKKSAGEIGNFGLETLKALAKGFIKTKIMQYTGIET